MIRFASRATQTSRKKVLCLYEDFDSTDPSWVLGLEAPSDQAADPTPRVGLAISAGPGHSRLFIDADSGKVGIGTTSPGSRLTAVGYVRAAWTSDQVDYTEIGHGGTNGFINTVGSGRLDFRHHGTTQMSVGADSVSVTGGWQLTGSQSEHTTADCAFYRYSDRVYLTVDGNLYIRDTSGSRPFHFNTETHDLAITDGGFRLRGQRASHVNDDGAFYRYNGQVYITVSDNLYIRDAGGDTSFDFNTDTHALTITDGGLALAGNRSGHHNTDGAFYRTNNRVYITVQDHLYVRDTSGSTPFHFNTDTHDLSIENGSLRLLGQRSSHVNDDGAFYRYNDQVYITVDDRLYIRDKSNSNLFYFNTDSGDFSVPGAVNAGSFKTPGTIQATGTITAASGIVASAGRITALGGLQVGGFANFIGSVNITDELTVDGITFPGSLFPSSREIKQDIRAFDEVDYSYSLEKMKATPVFRYRFKRTGIDSKQRIGVIAEDCPPDILDETGKAVSMLDFMGFLLAALKAQQTQIEALQAAILDTSSPQGSQA